MQATPRVEGEKKKSTPAPGCRVRKASQGQMPVIWSHLPKRV